MSYDIYPDPPAPLECGHLTLDQTHVMYWEQSGNVHGKPVVLLHGGPGAGISEWQKRLLDPRFYRIIAFDQRGCGKSRPKGEIRDNTTSHLVNDIELLRDHLHIERWLVFGGSWGSCLALAYAENHPDSVTGLILRGIFLGSKRETDWYLSGLRQVFPEAWRQFTEFLPTPERTQLLQSYHKRLLNSDPEIHLPAARAWCEYEVRCSSMLPGIEELSLHDNQHLISLARIQAHYFSHDFFMDGGLLMNNVNRIQGIPGTIIQGRYDMICPIASADQLQRSWPGVQYHVIANAGHSDTEPGTRRALVAATENFKKSLSTENVTARTKSKKQSPTESQVATDNA